MSYLPAKRFILCVFYIMLRQKLTGVINLIICSIDETIVLNNNEQSFVFWEVL
jgi:hypothetical protein